MDLRYDLTTEFGLHDKVFVQGGAILGLCEVRAVRVVITHTAAGTRAQVGYDVWSLREPGAGKANAAAEILIPEEARLAQPFGMAMRLPDPDKGTGQQQTPDAAMEHVRAACTVSRA